MFRKVKTVWRGLKHRFVTIKDDDDEEVRLPRLRRIEDLTVGESAYVLRFCEDNGVISTNYLIYDKPFQNCAYITCTDVNTYTLKDVLDIEWMT